MKSISLLGAALGQPQSPDYTGSLIIRLHFYGHPLRLQDSQDKRVSFGDGNCMFKMRRQ